MEPQAERRCHLLIGTSLTVLTVGIGYLVVFGTTIADFLLISAGMLLAWISFLYCLGNASFWD